MSLPPPPPFLPARPNFLPSLSEPSTSPLPAPQSAAGPSTQTPILRQPVDSTRCAICSGPSPKYTCPRCSLLTCSLPCSKAHKVQYACTGIRDPAAYIPLRDFKQVDWAGDYTFLEGGRRKVRGWGEGVKVEEVRNAQGPVKRPRKAGPGSEMRSRRSAGKLDGLKRELGRRGVEVEFMNDGMGRRKMNTSSWNPQTQALYLTIHLSVPSRLLGTTLTPGPETSIAHPRVLFSHPTQPIPNLASLLPAPPLDSDNLVCVIPFHPSALQPIPAQYLVLARPRLFFPELDSHSPLNTQLPGMAWVEFPVVQVFERDTWDKLLAEGKVVIVPKALPLPKRELPNPSGSERKEDEGKTKIADVERAKVVLTPTTVGRVGLGALLGDYNSDDEEEEAEAENVEGMVSADEEDVNLDIQELLKSEEEQSEGSESHEEEGDGEVIDDDEADEGAEAIEVDLRALGAAVAADLT